ncbi:MAG: bifunctional phosphoribosyl-AMP cyclohydrolase/phosphoribosyl-ATP diphosphatase HisIE [Saprospiraceae bacterium]|nr:bifunctional phosphoribosyl-AMP cyclohydrolase/phosphoribosyl-ATP diphosphatase HisIE [Saprospiraceae bacterium]
MKFDLNQLQFDPVSGLVPAIIQDEQTGKVLMLGYMNQEALDLTISSGRVTFFSRSKQRLWTKGETSGNYLNYRSVCTDCDSDALLIKAIPDGPTCHEGFDTCFRETNKPDDFISILERLIADRKQNPKEGSYTTSLFQSGIQKIAQKVGEEAVETILEAQSGNKENLIYETSDLIYHVLVLLHEKGSSWEEVLDQLKKKHKPQQ